MKKMTKIEMLEKIKTSLTDPDEIEFIQREIYLIEDRKMRKKPTKRQEENEEYKWIIFEELKAAENSPKTITELMQFIPDLQILSHQRVSAIVTQMVRDKYLVRECKGRTAYFRLAPWGDNSEHLSRYEDTEYNYICDEDDFGDDDEDKPQS